MRKPALIALFVAGFLGGVVFVYSCGSSGGGGGGGTIASAASINVGKAISVLPYTITEPGLYYLTRNLSPPSGVADGIIVNADHVTIDLMGFAMDGNNSTAAGISMPGRKNVEIRNGTVRGFTTGIQDNAYGGRGHRILNMRVWSNSSWGIELGTTTHMVKDSMILYNGGGGVNIGSGSTLSGNTVFSNSGDGIVASTVSSVLGNNVYDNTGTGINLPAGESVVDGNVSLSNTTSNYACVGTCAVGINHMP
jgi:hypothetical protein